MPNRRFFKGYIRYQLKGLGQALRGYTGIGLPKPSRRAFRALRRAGYNTTTVRGRTTIVGRTARRAIRR